MTPFFQEVTLEVLIPSFLRSEVGEVPCWAQATFRLSKNIV